MLRVRDRCGQHESCDTLHAKGDLVNVAAIFVQPGKTDRMPPRRPIASYGPRDAQRSWEYDRLSADYGNFLASEMLPLLKELCRFDCQRSPAIEPCVVSAVEALLFTWFQPDKFANVISHCGSTQISLVVIIILQ